MITEEIANQSSSDSEPDDNKSVETSSMFKQIYDATKNTVEKGFDITKNTVEKGFDFTKT